MIETYTITDPENVAGGIHISSVTDGVTGYEVAHYKGFDGKWFSVPIGVPLCGSCNAPVKNNHCPDCENISGAAFQANGSFGG